MSLAARLSPHTLTWNEQRQKQAVSEAAFIRAAAGRAGAAEDYLPEDFGMAKREALLNGKLPDYIERIKTNKSIEQLFEEIAGVGWKVNNLFQIPGGLWRCNLRFEQELREGIRSYFHEFADAYTAIEAVAAAIWNMQQRKLNPKTLTSAVEFNDKILLRLRENAMAHSDLSHELKRMCRQ